MCCIECAEKLQKDMGKCPVCRKKNQTYVVKKFFQLVDFQLSGVYSLEPCRVTMNTFIAFASQYLDAL